MSKIYKRQRHHGINECLHFRASLALLDSPTKDHKNDSMRIMKDALRYYINNHGVPSQDEKEARHLYCTLGGDIANYA